MLILIQYNNDTIKHPIVIISVKFVAIYYWIFNLNRKKNRLNNIKT